LPAFSAARDGLSVAEFYEFFCSGKSTGPRKCEPAAIALTSIMRRTILIIISGSFAAPGAAWIRMYFQQETFQLHRPDHAIVTIA
jgi:hypothetical protein